MPLKSRLSSLRAKIQETLEDAQTQALARMAPPAPLAKPGEEPPVVARLMVGERVAIEAQGTTPAQLVGSLTKTLFATPLLARAAVRAVIDGRKAAKGPGDDSK